MAVRLAGTSLRLVIRNSSCVPWSRGLPHKSCAKIVPLPLSSLVKRGLTNPPMGGMIEN